MQCWAQGWLGGARQPREPTTLTGNVANREEECSPESKTLHALPGGRMLFCVLAYVTPLILTTALQGIRIDTIILFSRRENGGSERLVGLPQATQMGSSRALSPTGAAWFPSSPSNRRAAAQGEP